MREIKFRAWDGKKMHYGGDVVIYLGEAWLEEMSLDAKAIHIKDTEGLVPLQFTGLKTRTGRRFTKETSFNGKLVTMWTRAVKPRLCTNLKRCALR
jgi:hypothetical protein